MLLHTIVNLFLAAMYWFCQYPNLQCVRPLQLWFLLSFLIKWLIWKHIPDVRCLLIPVLEVEVEPFSIQFIFRPGLDETQLIIDSEQRLYRVNLHCSCRISSFFSFKRIHLTSSCWEFMLFCLLRCHTHLDMLSFVVVVADRCAYTTLSTTVQHWILIGWNSKLCVLIG